MISLAIVAGSITSKVAQIFEADRSINIVHSCDKVSDLVDYISSASPAISTILIIEPALELSTISSDILTIKEILMLTKEYESTALKVVCKTEEVKTAVDGVLEIGQGKFNNFYSYKTEQIRNQWLLSIILSTEKEEEQKELEQPQAQQETAQNTNAQPKPFGSSKFGNKGFGQKDSQQVKNEEQSQETSEGSSTPNTKFDASEEEYSTDTDYDEPQDQATTQNTESLASKFGLPEQSNQPAVEQKKPMKSFGSGLKIGNKQEVPNYTSQEQVSPNVSATNDTKQPVQPVKQGLFGQKNKPQKAEIANEVEEISIATDKKSPLRVSEKKKLPNSRKSNSVAKQEDISIDKVSGTFLFTGTRGSGVSSTVAYTAMELVKKGISVCIIDLDIKTKGIQIYLPAVASIISNNKVKYATGLQGFISNPTKYKESCVEIANGFYVASLSLDTSANSINLQGDKLANAIAGIKRDFKVVLIDAPFEYFKTVPEIYPIIDRIALCVNNDYRSVLSSVIDFDLFESGSYKQYKATIESKLRFVVTAANGSTVNIDNEKFSGDVVLDVWGEYSYVLEHGGTVVGHVPYKEAFNNVHFRSITPDGLSMNYLNLISNLAIM